MGTPTCTALLIMLRSGASTSRCSCAQEAPRSAHSTSGDPNLGTWGRGWGHGDTQGGRVWGRAGRYLARCGLVPATWHSSSSTGRAPAGRG